MTKVEFVSYTGKYPNLCRGILTVKIDGKPYSFGDWWNEGKWVNGDYKRFWVSGGDANFTSGEENIEWGPWELNEYGYHEEDYPREVVDSIHEILRVMNENVEQGCCGGCL